MASFVAALAVNPTEQKVTFQCSVKNNCVMETIISFQTGHTYTSSRAGFTVHVQLALSVCISAMFMCDFVTGLWFSF